MATGVRRAADTPPAVTALAGRVRAIGMRWELADDGLYLVGNLEGLTDELLAAMEQHHSDIITYLRQVADTLAALETRLDKGWALCASEPDPERRARLDDHWIHLLHAYERVCTPGVTPCSLLP